MDAIHKVVGQIGRYLQGHACLADPARPGEREQAIALAAEAAESGDCGRLMSGLRGKGRLLRDARTTQRTRIPRPADRQRQAQAALPPPRSASQGHAVALRLMVPSHGWQVSGLRARTGLRSLSDRPESDLQSVHRRRGSNARGASQNAAV
jgi:hypothetical protein